MLTEPLSFYDVIAAAVFGGGIVARRTSMSEVFICIPCGRKHGRFDPTASSVGTFNRGACAWCGVETDVTSPSDYGYPALPERAEK